MHKLVLTEKFISQVKPSKRQKPTNQRKTSAQKQKNKLLRKHKLNLKFTCLLPNPSTLQKEKKRQVTVLKTKVENSLDSSIQNFMNCHNKFTKSFKNSRLSNYKVFNAIKRAPSIEQTFTNKLAPLTTKAKKTRNVLSLIELRHIQNKRKQKSLYQKIKSVRTKREEERIKKIDDFIPSEREYIVIQPKNVKGVKRAKGVKGVNEEGERLREKDSLPGIKLRRVGVEIRESFLKGLKNWCPRSPGSTEKSRFLYEMGSGVSSVRSSRNSVSHDFSKLFV